MMNEAHCTQAEVLALMFLSFLIGMGVVLSVLAMGGVA